jgi:phosphoribosylformylglycinamidine cyclo-ligase
VHSNGYSLVRRLVENAGIEWTANAPFQPETSLAAALLEPTRIYVKPLLEAIRQTAGIKALAHITGGGLLENIPRILPDGLSAHIDLGQWRAPAVFGWLQGQARLDTLEMTRTFNCGIGMVVIVGRGDVAAVLNALRDAGEDAIEIGELVGRDGPSEVGYSGSLEFAG